MKFVNFAYVSNVMRLWSIASWTEVTLGRGNNVAPLAAIDSLSSSLSSPVSVVTGGVASSVEMAGGRDIL